jgi:putative SOS response-associated peptidase YedK
VGIGSLLGERPGHRASPINARAETVASKPAFRPAFKERRCLVLADGFYEWHKEGARKQPYHIRLRDGLPLAFAGLWEHWEGKEAAIDSCTLLTTTPNAVMRPLHDRMPVILPVEEYDQWLDCRGQDVDSLQAILRSYPGDDLVAYQVSTRVNNPANETPECRAPWNPLAERDRKAIT